MRVIFCDNLIDRKVDPDFETEYKSAGVCGFARDLISYEELNKSNVDRAVVRVRESDTREMAIYRGWMLKPEQYALLYEALLRKNIELVNSPREYMTCHYLPASYEYIKDISPLTTWVEVKAKVDFDEVYQVVAVFKDDPIVVKDYVKSQKHHWESACYMPRASDKEQVRRVVSNFVELQGDALNVGLVFRKFEALEFLVNHSISNMPLTKEFRLFFLKGQLIQVLNYWDEGDYGETQPDLEKFVAVAAGVKSNFFTMDIAKKEDGGWIVMELGDGQVSGLPENADKDVFYGRVAGGLRGV